MPLASHSENPGQRRFASRADGTQSFPAIAVRNAPITPTLIDHNAKYISRHIYHISNCQESRTIT